MVFENHLNFQFVSHQKHNIAFCSTETGEIIAESFATSNVPKQIVS